MSDTTTPSSRWAADGQRDPHGDRYAFERAALALGNLTDDELANAVFLHGNEQPTMADMAAGKALAGIVYLTAAKDRIRWLSRALADAIAPQPAELAEQQGQVIVHALADAYAAGAEGLQFGGLARMEALAAALAATGEQQAGEVQGDGLHLSGEDRAVLQRIQDALPTVGLNGWTKGVEVLERLLRDSLAARQPGWNAEQLDRALGETIDQRDRYHEVADDLASHIERITGVEIGEHSSDNCPWQNAMEAAECYSPAQGIDLHQLVPPEWLSELIGGQMDDLTPGQAWRQGFNQCRDRTLLLVEQAMGFPAEQQPDAASGVGNG
jgi:hypothetical protein